MPRTLMATAATLALIFASLGGDEPSQKVEADKLAFSAPASWTKSTPKQAMRKAQLAVPAAGGDKEGGLLVVFALPGAAGGIGSNIDRYKGQFRSANGKPVEAATKLVKVKGLEVTRVEIAGTYKDPFGNGSSIPEARMLAAMVESGGIGYFIRLVGPEKTIKAAMPAFDAMIQTIAVDKD